jgi:hypothetical protein
VHHGNPKSVGEYYRRHVWHALDMFAPGTRHRLDRPTIMLFAQLLMTIIGIVIVAAARGPFAPRLTVAIALQLIVPAVTVLFRVRQTRRAVRLERALYLYWLYYWARAHALLLIVTARDRRFTV